MKQMMHKLLLFLLFSFAATHCGGSYKPNCYAHNGCHDAFASCYVTYALVIPNIDELNSLCIYRAYSCRQFCERCVEERNAPCFTNQYKPFFGLADGKEKQ